MSHRVLTRSAKCEGPAHPAGGAWSRPVLDVRHAGRLAASVKGLHGCHAGGAVIEWRPKGAPPFILVCGERRGWQVTLYRSEYYNSL